MGIQLYKWLIGLELEHLIYAFCDRNYESVVLPWKNIKIMPYEALKEGNYIYLVPLVNNEDVKNCWNLTIRNFMFVLKISVKDI